MSNKESKINMAVTPLEQQLLQDIRDQRLHTVNTHQFEIIASLEEYEVVLSDTMIEAMCYLQALDPQEVGYQLTYYLCSMLMLGWEKNEGIEHMLRLQAVLSEWAIAVSYDELDRKEKQMATAQAEGEL